jgi:glycine/D-amino acid oxidase-like deaminating enzyme
MRRVLIVGGGASGVLLAAHLLRDRQAPIVVTIVEQRGDLGAGIAYSTKHPDHLLNVRASNMSAYADDHRSGDLRRLLGDHRRTGHSRPGRTPCRTPEEFGGPAMNGLFGSKYARTASLIGGEMQLERLAVRIIGRNSELV